MARLVVEKGRDKGKVLLLPQNATFLVGRDLKTNLRLRDLQASRRHLKLTLGGGDAILEDLESSNGTLVNGERVTQVKLKTGDKIQVGETLIFYLEEESTDETQAVDTLEATKARKGELTGREVAGYRVGRLLGRGGMGTVYEAIQVSLDRRVAFKVLAAELAADGQFVDRFTAEARAAGQLNHPNIVQVYDVGFSNDVRFYSMEFMARGSIEDLLRKHGKLPTSHALAIAFDAARGLEYAERKGIVHRDIKPDNLMVSEDDVVKIGDLGIATRRRAEGEKGDDTISGSPHYIAPEQALGKAIDHRADLYALGVSLYQVLCGETPYEGSSAREVILKHLNDPAPPLATRAPDAPPEVVSLIERLMAKDPEKRPPSASAVLQELVPLLRRFPVSDGAAPRVDGFLSKRLELSIQTGAPSSISGRTGTASTGTSPTAVAPREPTPVPRTPARGPRARTLLLSAAAAVGAIALGAGTFEVVRTIQARARQAQEARSRELAAVRSLLEKDPARCRKEAHELAARFLRDGAKDDARIALDVEGLAAKRASDAAAEAHRASAAAALEKVRKALAALEDPADDPEKIARLEHTVQLLADIAKGWPGTPAGAEAEQERQKAAGALEEARTARTARLADEAELEKSLERARGAIDDLCAAKRFDDALAVLEGFERERGGTAPGRAAAGDLRQSVGVAVDRAYVETVGHASELAKGRKFSDAREALRALGDAVQRFPATRAQIADALARLDAMEHAQDVKEDAGKQRTADLARARLARDEAQASVKARRYEAAASVFEMASIEVKSPDVKAELDWRRERLKLASSAVAALIDFVKSRREKAGITTLVPTGGGDAEKARYVASDGNQARLQLTFHDEKDADLAVDLALSDVSAAALHDWTLRAADKDDGAAFLACAALALELERPDLARRDLAHARLVGVPRTEAARATQLGADAGEDR